MKKTLTLFSLLISFSALSQKGEWELLKADRSREKVPDKQKLDSLKTIKKRLFGSEDIDLGSDAAPSPRKGSTGWTDAEENLYVFGGAGHDAEGQFGLFDDLWKFNRKTAVWTKLNGDGNSKLSKKATSLQPSPRVGGLSWTDKNGDFWLFGGSSLGRMAFFEDLWRFDTKKNVWVLESGTEELNKAGKWSGKFDEKRSSPLGGRSGSSSWTDKEGNLIIFGGSGSDAESGKDIFFNDLWKFDITKRTWIQLSTNLEPNEKLRKDNEQLQQLISRPSGRRDALAWGIATSDKIWLYGGYGSDINGNNRGILADMWSYDLTERKWEKISGTFLFSMESMIEKLNFEDSLNYPGFRTRAVTWVDTEGFFWLMGGQNISSQQMLATNTDTWRFNPKSRMWKPVIGNLKPGIVIENGFYQSRENSLLFFGNTEYKTDAERKLPSNNIWKLQLK